MKVAVVTDDGSTISQHFGRAGYYEVLTVEDGNVTGRERREKPAHGPHHHHRNEGMIHLHEGRDVAVAGAGAGDTHGAMVAPVQDCQVLISRWMGHGAYNSLRGAGIQTIITDVRDIGEAVGQYLRGELVNHPERLH
jgi:predicted Fe-Mo cluster-binding NifX family protein